MKQYFGFLAVAVIVFVSFVSSATMVFAQTEKNIIGEPTESVPNPEEFCAKMAQAPTWRTDVSAINPENMLTMFNERKSIWQKADAETVSKRTQRNADRQVLYAQLKAKAATDSQKGAVKNFETTIEAVVTAREVALDAARTVFRGSVNALDTARQTENQVNHASVQAAVQMAFKQANEQCAAGINPVAVQKTFEESLRAARNAGSSDSSTNKKTPERQMINLAKTRNAAIESAIQTYQTALKVAIVALRDAFGEHVSSPTTPPPSTPPATTQTAPAQ